MQVTLEALFGFGLDFERQGDRQKFRETSRPPAHSSHTTNDPWLGPKLEAGTQSRWEVHLEQLEAGIQLLKPWLLPPRVCFSRSQSQELEPGAEPAHSDMRNGHLNR